MSDGGQSCIDVFGGVTRVTGLVRHRCPTGIEVLLSRNGVYTDGGIQSHSYYTMTVSTPDLDICWI